MDFWVLSFAHCCIHVSSSNFASNFASLSAKICFEFCIHVTQVGGNLFILGGIIDGDQSFSVEVSNGWYAIDIGLSWGEESMVQMWAICKMIQTWLWTICKDKILRMDDMQAKMVVERLNPLCSEVGLWAGELAGSKRYARGENWAKTSLNIVQKDWLTICEKGACEVLRCCCGHQVPCCHWRRDGWRGEDYDDFEYDNYIKSLRVLIQLTCSQCLTQFWSN